MYKHVTLKLYNIKRKKLHYFQLKSIGLIDKNSGHIQTVFQKMPFWRLLEINDFCFIHSEITESKGKWRMHPLFFEELSSGLVTVIYKQSRQGHTDPGLLRASLWTVSCHNPPCTAKTFLLLRNWFSYCIFLSPKCNNKEIFEDCFCLRLASFRADMWGLHLSLP